LKVEEKLIRNSSPPHLHTAQYASGSFSVAGADQPKTPNRKGESLMKSKKTLALATSILTLTISAFPHHAAAGTTTAPPTAGSQLLRKAGGTNLKYLQIVLAADTLLSALLP
jgi:hypothetical protein